jgi:hypothetical protein
VPQAAVAPTADEMVKANDSSASGLLSPVTATGMFFEVSPTAFDSCPQ